MSDSGGEENNNKFLLTQPSSYAKKNREKRRNTLIGNKPLNDIQDCEDKKKKEEEEEEEEESEEREEIVVQEKKEIEEDDEIEHNKNKPKYTEMNNKAFSSTSNIATNTQIRKLLKPTTRSAATAFARLRGSRKRPNGRTILNKLPPPSEINDNENGLEENGKMEEEEEEERSNSF
eukprot:TRINITY_DN3463_c0_g2_i1.p1 TRINITY_DN3463_c0_g2~~TRINITY_DN3463_c0_g2_i1.p1  ORF type:complete len:176 (+),score=90.24 TRINITY_DN3463_c0_g2_i1:40-567(+)